MKLTFLGGADEIGASGTLVETAGRRILVDCGIRHHKRDGETIPWLAAVQDAGPLDAMVLTHAHMDHSGAIPLAYRSFRAPIHMTAATHGLVSVLLADAIKVMEIESEREGDMPLYSAPMVEAALSAVYKTSFLDPVKLCEGVSARFFPAGHILGAASVLLESNEGSLMISGDVFATDQLTVPGLMLPPVPPEALVLECTYGNRLHANRAMEEKRLLEQLNEVIARGGITLIPAFAVGRSQEVLLLILKAIEQGKLPRVPVIIDGLVRQVCNLYQPLKDWCARWLRKRIKDLGNPFTYRGSPARMIRAPREREEVVKTAPAIIVASSGMLSGGPSQWYAGALAEDPKNHIALCGYNDEESPGRKLLELAETGVGDLKLGERVVTPQCSIGMYRLSAHSDASQLAAQVRSLKPRHLFLVHGEDGAREDFAGSIKAETGGKITLPELGTESQVVRKKGTFAGGMAPPETFSASDSPAPTQPDPPLVALLKESDLPELAKRLLDQDGLGHSYTVRELMAVWGYPPGLCTEEEVRRVDKVINRKGTPFARDKRRAFLYTVDPEMMRLYDLMPPDAAETVAPIAVMLKQIDLALPPETGLYRKGYQDEEKIVRLYFHFPKIAQETHRETLEMLEAVTRWNIVVHPEANLEQLKQLAVHLIPESWVISSEVSVFRTEERVELRVSRPPDPSILARIAQDFHTQTGFTLQVSFHPAASTAPGGPVAQPPDACRAPRPQMEINSAFVHIKNAFRDELHQPLKVGHKTDHLGKYIEVAFISPQIGELYEDVLERMATETGWRVGSKRTPDEFRLKQLAREMVAPWKIAREPALAPGGSTVRVFVADILSETEEQQVMDDFYQETGYDLVVEIRPEE